MFIAVVLLDFVLVILSCILSNGTSFTNLLEGFAYRRYGEKSTESMLYSRRIFVRVLGATAILISAILVMWVLWFTNRRETSKRTSHARTHTHTLEQKQNKERTERVHERELRRRHQKREDTFRHDQTQARARARAYAQPAPEAQKMVIEKEYKDEDDFVPFSYGGETSFLPLPPDLQCQPQPTSSMGNLNIGKIDSCYNECHFSSISQRKLPSDDLKKQR